MKTAPTVSSQAFAGDAFNWRNLRLLLDGEILPASLRWREELGDTVRIRMGHQWMHQISRAEDVSYVLVKNHKNFDKKTPGYRGLRDYLGHGLLSAFDMAQWARNRTIIQPLFQRDELMRQVPVILNKARTLTERLSQESQGGVFDLGAAMTAVTLGVLGEAILGCDFEEASGSINDAVVTAFSHATAKMYNPLSLPLFMPSPRNLRFLIARRKLRAIVGGIIREHRNHGDRDRKTRNLFKLFDEAITTRPELSITQSEIYDEFFTMIQAGHETTANGLKWVFLRLDENPEVLEMLLQEVHDDTTHGSYFGMESSSYLHKVICETLRLDPPSWGFDRRVLSDDVIGGYDVPQGSFIFVSPYVTHRHPEYWRRPHKFDPAHFDPEQVSARPRYAYFPFGTGPRVCIGQHFALAEMKVIISTLLRAGRIRVLNGAGIRRVPSVTLRPSGPILAEFLPK